jgi:hypothetical protein
MRRGASFPRGEWAGSPLRLFEGDRVQARDEDGDWFAGTLNVFGGGLEIVYEEPRSDGGCVESSRLLGRDEALRLSALLRPEPLWTEAVRAKRESQIWRAAHPDWRERIVRWARELVGRDPVAAEPILRRHLGRRVVVEIRNRARPFRAAGLLVGYDRHFVALADTVLPAETTLPLCPGRMVGADLEIHWNDAGLELLNRGSSPLAVRGLRTAEGLRPWEIRLKPGQRERTGFRRAPAGTAELVFESPVAGDAVLPRAGVRIRGASEGSVSIPALPDLETRIGDLPERGPSAEPGYETEPEDAAPVPETAPLILFDTEETRR